MYEDLFDCSDESFVSIGQMRDVTLGSQYPLLST